MIYQDLAFVKSIDDLMILSMSSLFGIYIWFGILSSFILLSGYTLSSTFYNFFVDLQHLVLAWASKEKGSSHPILLNELIKKGLGSFDLSLSLYLT